MKRDHWLRLSSDVSVSGLIRHWLSWLGRKGIVKLKSLVSQKKLFFGGKDLKELLLGVCILIEREQKDRLRAR